MTSTLMAVAGTLVWAAIALWRHDHLMTSMDLAIFHQGLSHLAHGQAPVVEIKGPGRLLFGDHFHPVVLAFVPLLWLWDAPGVLLVGQAVAFGLAAGILAHTAIGRLGRRRGVLVGAAFLASPGVSGAGLFDVHEVALGAPLLAMACRAFLDRHWNAVVGWGLALLLVKEDAGLVTAGLGLALVCRGQWRRAIGLGAAAVAWTMVAVRVLIPLFNPAGWTYASSVTGAGIGTTLAHALVLPGLATLTALLLWATTGCTAHRSPLVLAAVVPFTMRCAVDNWRYWVPIYHYNLLPCVVLAFCLVDIAGRRPLPRWRWGAALATSLACLACVVPANLLAGHSDVADARRVMACLPDGARVAADDSVTSHLVRRAEVTLLTPTTDLADTTQPTGSAGWVLLDTARGRWESELARTQLGGWTTVCRSRSVLLAARPDDTMVR